MSSFPDPKRFQEKHKTAYSCNQQAPADRSCLYDLMRMLLFFSVTNGCNSRLHRKVKGFQQHWAECGFGFTSKKRSVREIAAAKFNVANKRFDDQKKKLAILFENWQFPTLTRCFLRTNCIRLVKLSWYLAPFHGTLRSFQIHVLWSLQDETS